MESWRKELYHGGPGSGRWPWGSGDRPYQRLEGTSLYPVALRRGDNYDNYSDFKRSGSKSEETKSSEREKSKAKSYKDMTTEELREINNRLDEESRYRKNFGIKTEAEIVEENKKYITSAYKDIRNDVEEIQKKGLELQKAKNDRKAEEKRVEFNKVLNERVSNMSGEELKALTDRMRLEKNYKDLYTDDTYPTVVKGRDKTRELLATTGAVLAIGLAAADLYTKYQGIKSRTK